jgi:hypothetical protein
MLRRLLIVLSLMWAVLFFIAIARYSGAAAFDGWDAAATLAIGLGPLISVLLTRPLVRCVLFGFQQNYRVTLERRD